MITVGHNDIGCPPDDDPIQVEGIELARQILANEMVSWFQPEVDGEEFTTRDLRLYLGMVHGLPQGSKLVVRGRVFWLH